jgi:hypothetical protein
MKVSCRSHGSGPPAPSTRRQRDISFPTPTQLGERAISIDTVEKHIFDYAIEMRSWYIRNKKKKRTLSKIVRFVAITLLICGGLYPTIAQSTKTDPYLGYIMLGVAGGLYVFDRMFDISSSWMRDIAAMQTIDNAIYIYQTECAKLEFTSEAEENTTLRRLGLAEALATRVFDAVTAETAEWRSAFETAIVDLEKALKPTEGKLSGRTRNKDGN